MARPRLVLSRRSGVLAGAVLLYSGTFALGMAGSGAVGWSGVLTLLLGWTVIMKPAAQWSGPGLAGAMRAGATLLVLALLAAGIWAVGQGVAMLVTPPPLWAGWVLGIAGIALARAIWSPAREAEFERLLSEATAEIEGLADDLDRVADNPPVQAAAPPEADPLAALEARLDALATAAPPPWETIVSEVAQAAAVIRPQDLSSTLFNRARDPGASASDRAALVAGLTEVHVAQASYGQEDLAEAFYLLSEAADPDAMAHLVARVGALLGQFPQAWSDLPAPDWLESWALAVFEAGLPELADGLQALAQHVQDNLDHDD